MNTQELKEEIRRELPDLLRNDLALRDSIAELMALEFPRRTETNDRFYQMLEELRRDREEQTRKCEEQKRLNDLQIRKWEEQSQRWEELKAQDRLDREEFARHWEELKLESDRRWEEAKRQHDVTQGRFERRIGAIGSRWGTQSEKAFRDALAAILEQSFGVQVINVNEYDDTGEVFGRPEQVELDIIVKNGQLLILELKSSIDKAGMYIFERKARFYEKRHQRTADRLIVVSPMIDLRARAVGERLFIEMYGDSVEVPLY